MDGWVIVGTKLDSKQLEKDLRQAERKLQQFENEAEKLTKAKAKAEVDLAPYEEQKRLIQEMTDERNRYAQTEAEVTNNLNLEKVQLNELNEKYSKQLNNLEEVNQKIKENAKNQALVKTEIQDTNKKLVQSKGYDAIKDNLNDIGKSTSKIIKQVARWTLAVFGVRAVYGFVRNAVSTLSQYNEQLATDLEYIRFAIASSLQNAILGLIQLAYKLLTYINYLANAWFGINLFANASASAMNKSAKSAEKMKKSLAGFDEMNVINDSSSSGAGGGELAPSFDLSKMKDFEVPKWLIKVKEIGQWVIDNWETVVGQLLLIKLFIDLLTGNWLGVILDIAGFVILACKEIWEALKEIWASIKILFGMFVEWTKENVIEPMGDFFKNLWQGIKDGAVALREGIKLIFSQIGSWIYNNIIKPVGNFFSSLWNGIISGVQNAVQWVKNSFNSVVDFFRNIINRIVNLFQNIGAKVGDAVGGAFKMVVNSVLKAIEGLLNSPINTINSLIKTINKVPGIDLKTLPTFNLPRLAVGGIVNMPGRGINYGGANIGERGAEGVIPLTNSQMMAELGEAIGRYININATVPVYVGNRQIAREIKKINVESNFAFNK